MYARPRVWYRGAPQTDSQSLLHELPHCHATQTTKLQRTTDLGYTVFRCQSCGRTFNERTGTAFNFVEVPTDIVVQVLFFRVRYKLSYRDVAEMFLLRGFEFTHETVRDWEERFALGCPNRFRSFRRFLVLAFLDSLSISLYEP